MARYRTIKPELFNDEKLIRCSIDARFLFIGLLPFSEDMGRRRYNPVRIKYEVFPADDEVTSDVIDSLIGELESVGVIELYTVKDKRYIRIPHFSEHQYIRKLSHSTAPPSPSEGPDAKRCECAGCVKAEAEKEAKRNGRKMFPREQDVPRDALDPHWERTRDALGPSQYHTSESLGPLGSGSGSGNGSGEDQEQNQHQHRDELSSETDPSKAGSATSAENRRAERRALDGIALRMLGMLGVPSNPLILDTLVRSIEVRARSKGWSHEQASQSILARAALIAQETPPDSWAEWFEDARYEYVPQGDERLKIRQLEARPVCGSIRCAEGWEAFKRGEIQMLRRCPECAKLWRDLGLV